jgi:hypothetical protein
MGTSRRTRAVTISIGLSIGLVVSIARGAAADERCRVEVEGTESEVWAKARAALEGSLPRTGGCARIYVRIAAEDEARLIVQTRDGRQAERALRGPDELLPTTAALLITTEDAVEPSPSPAPPPASTIPPSPSSPSSSSEAPTRDKPPRSPNRASSTRRERVLLALQGGPRYGEGDLATPVLNALASLDIKRWEIGIMAGAEFGYADLKDETRPMLGSSVGAGLLFGRREVAGPMEWFVGARTMLALVTGRSEVVTLQSRRVHEDNGRAEPRLGAYAGAALPRSSAFRVRSELGVDFVPGEFARGVSASPPPLTPWWMASLQLGVELAL